MPDQPIHSDDHARGTRFTIIYDDLATGRQAKRFSDILAKSCGEAEVDLALCRSELLEAERIAAETMEMAEASDFVILALRGDAPLPFATKQWIEAWLSRTNGRCCAFIALFDPSRNTARLANSTRTYLRTVADAAGIDFFAHSPLAAPAEPKGNALMKTALTAALLAAA